MTTQCSRCRADVTDRYLCTVCTDMLADMLGEIPWLLEQLEVTRTCQDRLTVGAVGRDSARRWPLRVGAMRLAEDVHDMLVDWVERLVEDNGLKFFPQMSVGTNFIGPLRRGWQRLPAGYSGSPTQRARWLAHHINTIASREDCGQLYRDIAHLTGDPDKPNEQGRLVMAINRNSRVFAGPCPTLRGYDNEGLPIECGVILYALEGQDEIECPKCGQPIDVKANRLKAATDRDLLTEKQLFQVLDDIGEHVPRVTFYAWLKEQKVRPRGFLHDGEIVPQQVRKKDPRVFSVSAVRALRSQEAKMVS